MAGTSRDMTEARPGWNSPAWALYGDVDPHALSLTDLQRSGAALRQIPIEDLMALETGSPVLRSEAFDRIAGYDQRPLRGAAGFNDAWNTALAALNPQGQLDRARRLVADKSALYTTLHARGVTVPRFIAGPLNPTFLAAATGSLGPRPVLKPAMGSGSRGVYRWRADLNPEDNLALYRQILQQGHIDTSTPILAVEYVGGTAALEVSADIIVAAGQVAHAVVHEKATATQVHPYVDRVMISPPTTPAITEALGELDKTITGLVDVLDVHDGVLHAELRLHLGAWVVLDVGIRPGAGLVAHSAHARTGVDPRLVHLLASIGLPTTIGGPGAVPPAHLATAIACCYVTPASRTAVSFPPMTTLASELDANDHVFGWHLNVAVTGDALYLPDAGLSLGVGGPDAPAALGRLRTLIGRHDFATT